LLSKINTPSRKGREFKNKEKKEEETIHSGEGGRVVCWYAKFQTVQMKGDRERVIC